MCFFFYKFVRFILSMFDISDLKLHISFVISHILCVSSNDTNLILHKLLVSK